jgi:hypothetical protein
MTATVLGFDARAGAPLGFASGPVRATLRLEGAAAFATVAALYLHAGFSWPLFALLFLAPDLSMLGYLISARTGAAVYNVAHTHCPGAAARAGGLPRRRAGGPGGRADLDCPYRLRSRPRLRPQISERIW